MIEWETKQDATFVERIWNGFNVEVQEIPVQLAVVAAAVLVVSPEQQGSSCC
jgi:hypothetical protein